MIEGELAAICFLFILANISTELQMFVALKFILWLSAMDTTKMKEGNLAVLCWPVVFAKDPGTLTFY